MNKILDFIYGMELYELIASSLMFGFSITLLGAWLALSHSSSPSSDSVVTSN